MHRSVVCISRVVGSGGEDVGRLVAVKLDVRYLDDEIIAQPRRRVGCRRPMSLMLSSGSHC